MEIKTKIVSLAFGMGMLFCVILPAFASETVNVATVLYPPLVFEEAEPEFGKGMLRDIVTDAFAVEDISAQYDLLPMSRNVWSIVKRVQDCCLGSMEWFKRRGMEDKVEAVDIIQLNFVGFYQAKRFPEGVVFNRLEDLNRYSFGNVRGSSSQRVLDDAGLQTDLASDIRINFLKLNAGRFDFAVAFRVTGEYLIWELFPEKAPEFSFTSKPIQQMKLSVIFQKRNRPLKERFIKGLGKIARDGTYYSILKRYHMNGVVPEDVIPENLKGIVKK
ncbi:transporter substrate-binding domain-containing protein [Maridesulfovibrio sp.]|uniref:substrate-binding periplasmic protein n=1 Tax=Maridesulfovibrio sp. TaxID=2795000 RepID=UPI002A189723|nr:transporter substrate-binding domain-containing protein [Maridesulfovibrio sp.]